MAAVLGLKADEKKPSAKSKDNKAKAKIQDSDAQAFLNDLEKKQEASPDTCLFC